ncbi:secreted protein [Beggiatoa sp. PS]|nr:secreted protein [Beggiatoa sp. PS]
MRRTKITLVIAGFILGGMTHFNVVNAAVQDDEWKIGTQCLDEAGLPPAKLLCMALTKQQLSSVMRAGFLIGTKTRQPWCNLVDKLGLRASAEDARGKEEMAGCDSNGDYARAFERGGKVVRCMTTKIFTDDMQQWGNLATHMYFCGELGSSGDCVAAVEIAKTLRGKEPDCQNTGSLWRWASKLDYRRVSLNSVYDDNCAMPAKKMLPYCESLVKDKNRCKSLFSPQ